MNLELKIAESTIRDLEAHIDEFLVCLKIVSAGIWHDKERNACGIGCGSAAVHEVERLLEKHGQDKIVIRE